jgi:hypothetical protein
MAMQAGAQDGPWSLFYNETNTTSLLAFIRLSDSYDCVLSTFTCML